MLGIEGIQEVRVVAARADQALILDARGVRSPSWSHVAGVRRPSLCHGTAVDCIPRLYTYDPCTRVSRSWARLSLLESAVFANDTVTRESRDVDKSSRERSTADPGLHSSSC
jgi:hypothetical protein